MELPPPLRSTVGTALKERLEGFGAFVLCMAIAGQHVHLLAKMPKGVARDWSGTAKQHAWFVLRERGWKGKLWGKRGKAVTIRDRRHQLNVYRYILRHADEGAWVWAWKRDGENGSVETQ